MPFLASAFPCICMSLHLYSLSFLSPHDFSLSLWLHIKIQCLSILAPTIPFVPSSTSALYLFLVLPPQYIKMPFILFNESNWKFGCYLHHQDLMSLSKTEHMSMLLDAWCYYSELIGNASHLGGIYSNLGLFFLISYNS